jgi:hypothetical protein
VYRLPLTAALVALVCWPSPSIAADSRIGLILGQTKEGASVARVADGSVADFMGFKEGDVIVRYTYATDKEKANPRVDDMKELLDSKQGYYKIVVRSKNAERTIAGTLKLKEDKKTLIFIRDR